MSYLTRLAQQTAARFRPLRAQGFAGRNMLRVEDAIVETPALPQPAEMAGTVAQRGVVAAQMGASQAAGAMRLAEGAAAMEPARSPALEVRRELPDAIEEVVLFGPGDAKGAAARFESTAAMRAAPGSEAPDARQAESVLARVRALTRQKTVEGRNVTTEAVELLASGAPAEAPTAPVVTAASAPKQREARGVDIPAADFWQLEDRRPARPVAETGMGSASASPKAARGGDGLEVNIGSILVHLEAETPVAMAPPAPRQGSGQGNVDQARDFTGRLRRSYLDRY